MAENYITFNVSNMITVVLMVIVAFFFLGMFAQFYHYQFGS